MTRRPVAIGDRHLSRTRAGAIFGLAIQEFKQSGEDSGVLRARPSIAPKLRALFFHDFHHDQYDSERDRWLTGAELDAV